MRARPTTTDGYGIDAAARREILIVGLGSVGRRHLMNLRALGWNDIRLHRTGRSTLPDSDLADFPVEHDLDAALARRPLAVVVSNPSSLHLPVAVAAARAGAHVFVEKPLAHTLDGLAALEDALATRGLTLFVGFQFRFNPGLRQLKAWIDQGAIGEVVSVQVHWGECLPDMHPWEDYRQGYAARPELGGGVLLTFCHVFDYHRWIVGEIGAVTAIESNRDGIGVDVETCVDLLLGFGNGATGHVHLDFVQRPRTHHLTVVGTNGTVLWSEDDHAARRYDVGSKSWETVQAPEAFERNLMFLEEMRHFLACLHGEAAPLCTLHDGREVVRIVMSARRALEWGGSS